MARPPPSLMGLRPPAWLGQLGLHPSVQLLFKQMGGLGLLLQRPRSVALVGTIGASAATAVAVALVWAFLIRGDASPPTTSADASALPPGARSSPMPPAPLSSKASDASSGGAAGRPPSPSGGANLAQGFGDLIVTSTAEADVFINGRNAGTVNQPLRVRCGRYYVRLGRPTEGQFPQWVSAGMTVQVACQESTRVEMLPLPIQVPPPRR